MSFGFSIGDFLAVISLASKIRKEFVDAPSQFKAISDEYVYVPPRTTCPSSTESWNRVGLRALRSCFKILRTAYQSQTSTRSKRASSRILLRAAATFSKTWNEHSINITTCNRPMEVSEAGRKESGRDSNGNQTISRSFETVSSRMSLSGMRSKGRLIGSSLRPLFIYGLG